MRYISIGNQPNVSGTRSESISPSLKIDSRGFPHVAWLDKGNNINEVMFSYWDGLKWAFKDIPRVYSSQENITYSPNALVLDTSENPIIVFSKKLGIGSRLFLASYSNQWDFNTLDVGYDIGWLGVTRYDRNIDPDFSSSSSTISLDSSLSSSSLSVGNVTSSSSTSSSSSLDSASSSSSSSYNDAIYFVTVYDSTNSEFKIYSVGNIGWTLLGSKPHALTSFESMRIDDCGKRIGIAFIDTYIKYNFFDIESETWSFVSFKDVISSQLYGDITEMDVEGSYSEGASVMTFGWLSKTTTMFYVNCILCYNNGVETPPDGISPVIESNIISVTTTSNYIVNGYNKIGVSIGGGTFNIFVMGLSTKLFYLINFNTWATEFIDISGISNGIVANSIRTEYYGGVRLVVEADSGDIYYFTGSASETFPLSKPDMLLLNNLWTRRSTYSNGILSGTDISGTYNVSSGGVLYDSERPLLISSNQSTPVTTTTTTTGIGPTTTTTTTSLWPPSYTVSGFGSDVNGCYNFTYNWGDEVGYNKVSSTYVWSLRRFYGNEWVLYRTDVGIQYTLSSIVPTDPGWVVAYWGIAPVGTVSASGVCP